MIDNRGGHCNGTVESETQTSQCDRLGLSGNVVCLHRDSGFVRIMRNVTIILLLLYVLT